MRLNSRILLGGNPDEGSGRPRLHRPGCAASHLQWRQRDTSGSASFRSSLKQANKKMPGCHTGPDTIEAEIFVRRSMKGMNGSKSVRKEQQRAVKQRTGIYRKRRQQIKQETREEKRGKSAAERERRNAKSSKWWCRIHYHATSAKRTRNAKNRSSASQQERIGTR